jgi:hypothetical protein
LASRPHFRRSRQAEFGSPGGGTAVVLPAQLFPNGFAGHAPALVIEALPDGSVLIRSARRGQHGSALYRYQLSARLAGRIEGATSWRSTWALAPWLAG